MDKRYFKVVIKEPLSIPLTVEQHKEAPTLFLKTTEYKERIVEVEFKLDRYTDPEKFNKMIKKVIKGNYRHVHSIEEYFMPENQLEQTNK
jgi:hypothetical protein